MKNNNLVNFITMCGISILILFYTIFIGLGSFLIGFIGLHMPILMALSSSYMFSGYFVGVITLMIILIMVQNARIKQARIKKK